MSTAPQANAAADADDLETAVDIKFDPREIRKHLIKVQGGRMYLPVNFRLVWFRNEHPDWGIETEPVVIDEEKQYAIFRAKIYNEHGQLVATGTKREDVRGFPDWLEKSETGAIGRALAVCGYGTQFVPEFDEMPGKNGPRYADSPTGGQGGNQAPQRPAAPQQPGNMRDAQQQAQEARRSAPQAAPEGGEGLKCTGQGCGKALTRSQQELSVRHYGAALCPACQRDHARQPQPAAGRS